MPIPIAVGIRHQIVERRQAGTRLPEIARDLGMSYHSVRNVWRLYQKEGRTTPNYAHCGPQGVKASDRVYRAALFLKRLHPRWGAGLIRQIMVEKWSDEGMPGVRSLQRWFRQAGRVPKRPKPGGAGGKGRGQLPHQVWEMDSRQDIELASGEKVVWLVASDEASGAVLKGTVFPHCQSRSTECGSGGRVFARVL